MAKGQGYPETIDDLTREELLILLRERLGHLVLVSDLYFARATALYRYAEAALETHRGARDKATALQAEADAAREAPIRSASGLAARRAKASKLQADADAQEATAEIAWKAYLRRSDRASNMHELGFKVLRQRLAPAVTEAAQ